MKCSFFFAAQSSIGGFPSCGIISQIELGELENLARQVTVKEAAIIQKVLRKRKMNVCMVAYTLYENDTRVIRYAEALANRGHMVDVVALKSKTQYKFTTLNRINIYRIEERAKNEKGMMSYLYRLSKFFIKSAFFLTKKYLQNHYDIIHVHSVPDFEVFAALFPKLMGAKIILDIHDPVPDFFAAKFGSARNRVYIKLLVLLEKLSGKFADHVITVTNYWKEVISKRSNIPEKKFSVVVNFPDTTLFNPKRVKKKEKSKQHFTLLYPGTFQKHCGLDIAIKAVDLAKQEIPSLRFFIYGSGDVRDEIQLLVKKLGLEEYVFFYDFVPLERVPEIICEADVGISLLSGYEEYSQQALSVKLFEFLAMGLPVIATKTKALDYYLDDSVVMFSKANDPMDVARCMKELYWNPKKRLELIKNGLRYIEKNNWELKKNDYYRLVYKLGFDNHLSNR